MRVLFTTPVLEHPAKGGPQLRIQNSIKILNRVCDIYLHNRAIKNDSIEKESEFYFSSITKKYYVTFLFKHNYKNLFVDKIMKLIDTLTRTRRSYESIHAIVKQDNINVIWFGYGNISYSLIKKVKKNIPHIITVCDTDSVWSRYILRELPHARGIRKFIIYCRGNLKKIQEKKIVRISDVITAVSFIDAQYYKSITKMQDKIKIFSNIIDLDDYPARVETTFEIKKPAIYLAGTFGRNSPMNSAARWLVSEIMPLVWAQQPNLYLYLIGRNSSSQLGLERHKNIIVTGEVMSVLPLILNTDVAIVPLQFESGTRFKILEAGACRIPVVTTYLGAEGLRVKNNEHVLMADTPQDFANAILQVLNNKESSEKMANKCFELVKEKYSIKSGISEVTEIFMEIKSKFNIS